jgi:hypothetical protein
MSSLSAVSTDEPGPLRIYLEYDYLLAEDLADILACVHVIYEQTFWSEIPALIGTPHQRSYSIRVVRADTSHSILLEFQALGQVVAGLDPTLAGIGGGAVVLGLTARILINTFRSGHQVMSAAAMQRLEVQMRRNEIAAAGARSSLEIERAQVDLEIVRRDAEFRDFVQSAIRAAATADFARAVSRNEAVIESVGAALLNGWSVLQGDNITTAQINDVEVKSPEGDTTDAQQDAGQDGAEGSGESTE